MTLAELRDITKQKRWATFAASLLQQQGLAPDATFGTHWIEAGHHMREQIADDHMLARLLRKMLPPYEGKGIDLFRGENKSRWEQGSVGLAWTTSAETARMFAAGLNAVHSGGVLLKGHFEPTCIISGPNSHSAYLGEAQFTVEPFTLSNVTAIAFFPAIE